MTHMGNRDKPVSLIEHDRLFMESQVSGLAEFIQNCETPLTISIQGAWGTGKTSFVNMVKNRILGSTENQANDDFVFVPFNSWQFVQFDMSDQLCTSMIVAITKELEKGIKNHESAVKTISSIFNGIELFIYSDNNLSPFKLIKFSTSPLLLVFHVHSVQFLYSEPI